jgi:hypothetical protein
VYQSMVFIQKADQVACVWRKKKARKWKMATDKFKGV